MYKIMCDFKNTCWLLIFLQSILDANVIFTTTKGKGSFKNVYLTEDVVISH